MPKNFDLEQRSERACAAASKLSFQTNHDEEWRNKLGRQLNEILSRVEYEMQTCLPPTLEDVEFAEAALSVVERVANFEEINRK